MGARQVTWHGFNVREPGAPPPSRTRVVVGVLVVLMALIGFSTTVNRTEDAVGAPAATTTPVSADHTKHGDRDPSYRCIPPSGPEQTCASWGKKQVKRFKHGRLGHSRQLVHQQTRHWKKIVRKAEARYLSQHPRMQTRVARGFGDWCDICDLLPQSVTCMAGLSMNPVSGSACADASDDQDDIRDATKSVIREAASVSIVCGGSALIANGGVSSPDPRVMILRGVAGCAWGVYADRVVRAEGCRPHTPCREAARVGG